MSSSLPSTDVLGHLNVVAVRLVGIDLAAFRQGNIGVAPRRDLGDGGKVLSLQDPVLGRAFPARKCWETIQTIADSL